RGRSAAPPARPPAPGLGSWRWSRWSRRVRWGRRGSRDEVAAGAVGADRRGGVAARRWGGRRVPEPPGRGAEQRRRDLPAGRRGGDPCRGAGRAVRRGGRGGGGGGVRARRRAAARRTG